jgi:pimeloyl-ACP methyl ester carboxylesterase
MVAQARLIAVRIRHAELVILLGVSHLLFAERPAEYARSIDGWLRTTV